MTLPKVVLGSIVSVMVGFWAWLGPGFPALGLYPNLQALSVQGLLLAGAGLALAAVLPGARDVESGGAALAKPVAHRS